MHEYEYYLTRHGKVWDSKGKKPYVLYLFEDEFINRNEYHAFVCADYEFNNQIK